MLTVVWVLMAIWLAFQIIGYVASAVVGYKLFKSIKDDENK